LLDDAGTDIGAIQKLLGHQDRQTTELYLYDMRDKTKEATDVLAKALKPEMGKDLQHKKT